MTNVVAEALERVEAAVARYFEPGHISLGGVICSAADLRILIDAVRSGSSRDLAQPATGAHAMGEGREADAWMLTFANDSGGLVFTEEEADDIIAEAQPGATKRPLFAQPEPLTVPETPRQAATSGGSASE